MLERIGIQIIIEAIMQGMACREIVIREKVKEIEETLVEEMERSGILAQHRVTYMRERLEEYKQDYEKTKIENTAIALVLKVLEDQDNRLKILEEKML